MTRCVAETWPFESQMCSTISKCVVDSVSCEQM